MAGQASADYDVRSASFLRIRYLTRDHRLDVGVAHSPAGANAVHLNLARRRYDDNAINPLLAAGFKQQRDVKHHSTSTPPPGARDEGTLLLPHHWVQDALQPGECVRVAQYRVTQCRPVHRAVAHRPGKRRLDRVHRPATTRLQIVHCGIRVEHRDACPAERRGRSRLPHPYAASQAKDDHRVSRSATTNWRSSSSTRGSTPNQAWKPGTAW